MTRSMRVAIVAPFPVRKIFPDHCRFTKPGTEHPASWIVNLVRALSQHPGVELHLVTVKSHLAAEARFLEDGIHTHILHGTRNTIQPLTLYEFDRRRLVHELKQIQPDVVESFGTEGPFSYAGVTSGFPCVIKIQGIIKRNLETMGWQPTNYLWWRYFITQFVEQTTFRRCDEYIADNEFMGDFALETNPQARIHYIPNLIAPPFFDVRQNWSVQRRNILYVGSLKHEKGTLDLLEAFSQLHKVHPDAHLRLVGGAGDGIRTEIETFCAVHGLTDHVHLLGMLGHGEIIAEMGLAAFLAHPSWADSSPNTVYEAMIAGLPVIASRVGGLPYMVDENTGCLVEPRNPNELAAAMMNLYASPEQQKRLGEHAMDKMRRRFASEHIVEQILAVYQEMLSSRPGIVRS